MSPRSWAVLPILLSLLCCAASRGDQPQWAAKYDVVAIDLAGRTEVRALNDQGMVVGVSFGKDGGLRGFVYYPTGSLLRATGQLVPAPRGAPELRVFRGFRAPGRAELVAATAFEPVALNNRLFVAGSCWGSRGEKQFLVAKIDRDEAETAPLATTSTPRAGLNQKGDAAFGQYRWDAPPERGRRPAPVDLTRSVGDMGFRAEAINDLGAVVGSMMTDETHGTTVPVLLDGGMVTTLAPAPRKGSFGAAHAINGRGEVVGESDEQPFRWLNGTFTRLPHPSPTEPADRRGPSRGVANAVNGDGLVVGASDGTGRRHAVLWQADHVYDLNTLIDPGLGWTLEEATGINRSGQICGNGTLRGTACGFLLTPRPRPVR